MPIPARVLLRPHFAFRGFFALFRLLALGPGTFEMTTVASAGMGFARRDRAGISASALISHGAPIQLAGRVETGAGSLAYITYGLIHGYKLIQVPGA